VTVGIATMSAAARASKIARSYIISLSVAALGAASAILVGVEGLGQVTGATWLPRSLAAAQSADLRVLALPPEISYWGALKLPRIKSEQPEVVLIGSSRGNQFRSAMFAPYRFYNASLTAWTVDQMIDMVDRVTTIARPRVIIVGLDFFMFEAGYADGMNRQRTMVYSDTVLKYRSDLNFMRDLFKYPDFWMRTLPVLMREGIRPGSDGMVALGADAMRVNAGFRQDGSFRNPRGYELTAPAQMVNRDHFLDHFGQGAVLSETQVAALETLAALARERHVQLVAIQMPIFAAAVELLDNGRPQSAVLDSWHSFEQPELRQRFNSMNIPFFDLSRAPFTSNPRHFNDSAHPTESGTLGGLFYLLQDPRFAGIFPKLDAGRLGDELADAERRGEYHAIYGNGA
jgi:hypothetical protein